MAQPGGTARDVTPVVIDLGKVRSKAVRDLKRGGGELLGEVQDALVATRQRLGPEAAGKELVPIVLLYRKKKKRRRGTRLFPFF